MTAAQDTTIQRHVQRADQRILQLRALDKRLSWLRLIIFFVAVAVCLPLFTSGSPFGWLALLIAVAAFSIAVSQQHRVQRALQQFQLWRKIKTFHLARRHLEWGKLPPALSPSPLADHPFEADLNLVGERSLHHLLDTTVSLDSALRLRDRLLTTPPDIPTVLERQALVRELTPLTYFRDRLTVDARLTISSQRWRWDTRQLAAWFANPAEIPGLRRTLWLTAGLAALNILLLVLNQAGILPPLWALSLLAYVGLSLSQMRHVAGSFDQAMSLYDALSPLVEIARRLESRSFAAAPRLKQLCAPFQTAGRPSNQLRRLGWLASAASLSNNPLVWLFLNTLLPWELFVAYQLNRYRLDMADRIPVWLDAWFELETASALATFAALNPGVHLPRIRAGAVFEAHGLGHPLIPAAARVCNDLTINHLGEVLLITGSNMSGKSSFLRTLGINCCLAYAGGAVAADSLDIGLFRLFTCIHISDSINDGFSYFYAEVRRLRALLTALESDDPLPLYFLIDEIFRATNNQERLIGSRAYLQTLVGKHGIGAITTHDLELTQLEGPVNYHFEDQVVDGKMSFDYRLRPGPSPTTNALKIMRLAGLPVTS